MRRRRLPARDERTLNIELDPANVAPLFGQPYTLRATAVARTTTAESTLTDNQGTLDVRVE